MTRGEVEYAVRKAHEHFDRWNDVTGCIPKLTGHYYEVLAVIEDAVNIGAMIALGLPLMVTEEDITADVCKDQQSRIATLEAQLEQVQERRDEAHMRDIEQGDEVAHWIQQTETIRAERDALAAEGRLLREAERERDDYYRQMMENNSLAADLSQQLDAEVYKRQQAEHERDQLAAEVERMKLLEAVAEAAESSHHALAMGENITPAFERLGHALAAWREGEAPNAHL